MLVRFWCKFGATLYATILTIFTISHGVAKTQRDKEIDARFYEQTTSIFFWWVSFFLSPSTYRSPMLSLVVSAKNSPPDCFLHADTVLQEISSYLIYKKLCYAGLFVFYGRFNL